MSRALTAPAFILAASAMLTACGETPVPRTSNPDPANTAPAPANVTIDRLPESLLDVVANSPAECTSTYGPLVIRPTEFDFGWGTARFQSIRREGEGYAIRAEVTAEGQAEGPEMEDYVLTPLSGGGVTLVMGGGESREYRPCDGPTSGVSVDVPPPGPPPVPYNLPISPGVYVLEGTDCARAANAAFRIYDGRGISGSATRACRATVVAKSGRTYTLDQSCEDTYSGRRTTARQTFVVEGADGFQLTEAGETAMRFKRCPSEVAPAELRRLAESG